MTVIEEIASERQRQIEVEDNSLRHDDEHVNGELAIAAACYASPVPIKSNLPTRIGNGFCEVEKRWRDPWPWDDRWDKRHKHPRRRQLVIAAALIVAEIQRLDRIEAAKK